MTKLRSREWFDNPVNPDMTALYLERYLNYGITRDELQSGKPIIGIAQTGSDLSPCNRHHLDLAKRVREWTWDELVASQRDLERSLRGTMTTRAKEWGVTIHDVGLTDLTIAKPLRLYGDPTVG